MITEGLVFIFTKHEAEQKISDFSLETIFG